MVSIDGAFSGFETSAFDRFKGKKYHSKNLNGSSTASKNEDVVNAEVTEKKPFICKYAIARCFCQRSNEENFCLFRLFAWTSLLTLVTSIIFLLFPEIDLWAARLLFSTEYNLFLFQTPEYNLTVKSIRWWFHAVFIIASVVAVMVFMHRVLQGNLPGGLCGKIPLFFVLAFILGPGIITNVILKDNWGRARPVQVTEFGGLKSFTPPLLMANNCERNCSFISGEASTIYMLFLALALVVRRARFQLIMLAIIIGSASGLVRMGLGGHFLSDVIFAGLFMSFTVLGCYWLIFGNENKTSPLGKLFQSIGEYPVREVEPAVTLSKVPN